MVIQNWRWFFPAVCLALLLAGTGCSAQPPHITSKPLYALRYDPAAPRERVVLILPGLGQTSDDPAFRSIARDYQAKGITPVGITMDWKRMGLHGFARAAGQVSSGVREVFPRARVFLFGFSFGAVLAYELSETLHPVHVLLCSMSPVFDEDRVFQFFPLKQAMNYFIQDAASPLSYARYRDKCFVFLYGEHESFLINPAIIAHRCAWFKGNQIVIVKNARHKLEAGYLNAIEKMVSEIP